MQITKVKLVVIVVIAVLVGSTMNALYGDSKSEQASTPIVAPTSVVAQPTSTPVPTVELSTWSENDKKEYLTGCLAGGEASEAYCVCTLNIAQKQYTPSQAKQLGSDYQSTGEIPQEFIAIATACLHTL